jgi:hypothetical protein
MRGNNNGSIARGVVRFLTLRIGWLRSPVVPNHSASSFSKRQCNLDAKIKSE